MTINVINKGKENRPTNAEFLNAMAEDVAVSREVASTIKEVGTENMSLLYQALTTGVSRKNDFINSLYNPTVVNHFFSKLYEDKLSYFLNGELEMGDSIQQIYVQRSLRKGFAEHFDDKHNTTEGDLIARVTPVVSANIIQVNFQHKFKVSVDMRELKKAMLREYGLFDFVGQLIMANINGANKQEFDDIHHLLDGTSEKTYMSGTYVDSKLPKGVIQQAWDTGKSSMFVKVATGNDLAEKIIQYTGDLEEYSDAYSLAKDEEGNPIETFTNRENLVLILTNEMKAKMNVQTLATAFNTDYIELPKRVLTVKSFNPLTGKEGAVGTTGTWKAVGILMDKDLIQCWDTFKDMAQFTNVEGKYYNSFLHVEGIKAVCPFCQFIVFYADTE